MFEMVHYFKLFTLHKPQVRYSCPLRQRKYPLNHEQGVGEAEKKELNEKLPLVVLRSYFGGILYFSSK